MKTLRKYLLPVTLFCVALALPSRSVAAPGQTFHFRFMGLTADTFFDNFEGCVETSAEVEPMNGRIKTAGGGPEATSSVFVGIFQFDNCSGAVLLSAFGSADLPAGAFQIDKKLTSATLSTSLDVFDFVSSTSFPVDVTMSWTAVGPPTMSMSHSVFKAPGLLSISTFHGTSRAATASGSVTALGTNFSPNPAVFADLNSVKEGDLTVTHPSH